MRKNTAQEKKKFQEMCKIDHRLAELHGMAVSLLSSNNRDYDFWNNYEHIKRIIRSSVGWDCPNNYPEWMWTSEAFDIAFNEVFEGIF
jgi:hypothetical protein